MALALVALVSALGACATEAEQRREAQKKADYHYQLGASYFNDKLIPQALRELLLCVETSPDNAQANHLLGFIYLGRKDYPRAVEYFKKSVEIDPQCLICLNNLGTAYLASERWDEAIDLYDDLVGKPMYNTPELAYNNLGWAYYNRGQLDRAREQFEMAVFLKPQMCLAHNNLGLVYARQGNLVGAMRSFEAAIKGCPEYAEPNFHIAQVLMKRSDPNARYYYQRCYELAANATWGDRCRSYLEVVP